MTVAVERHPLKPFIPSSAKLLMLGSFPPQKRKWAMDFYYPNLINDMWRIMGLVFFDDKYYFTDNENKTYKKDKITRFLTERGIALYDTATAIRRLKDNASDKFLEVVEQTDIKELLGRMLQCRTIVVTGDKAAGTAACQLSMSKPNVGEKSTFEIDGREISLYRMPSSSRAYPMKIEQKADIYKSMFNDCGLL